MPQINVSAKLPEKLGDPIFRPSRYKIFHGGRGGGKSHAVAIGLLLQGLERSHRVLCAREYQSSISDSVHRLLSDKIVELGLQQFYEVQKSRIIGQNGTEFVFAGLRHNIGSIKSFEGCTRVWVEEAQNVSKESWDVLIPTIRSEGSEIWVTFNPELAEDETYARFVSHPPPGSIVTQVNYTDNPWFPDVLRSEMEHLKKTDEESYRNVWLGECRTSVRGAVYGAEISRAMREGRITRVPYDESKPVHTFWDLGWGDYTAIWFYQCVGLEHRYIDYSEVRLTTLQDIVRDLQARPYIYGRWMLPHDGAAQRIEAHGRSIQTQIQEMIGRKINVGIVPNIGFEEGKNIARLQLNSAFIDADKCEKGLYALRHYHYKDNPETGTSTRLPVHDESSHGADAFRYSAVGWKQAESYTKATQKTKTLDDYGRSSTSDHWMEY